MFNPKMITSHLKIASNKEREGIFGFSNDRRGISGGLWFQCQAKMLGLDITLHAVTKINWRVLRDSEGESVSLVYKQYNTMKLFSIMNTFD